MTLMQKSIFQRVQEVTNTSPKHSFEVAIMAVKTCSKVLSTLGQRHGKSPCFLQVTFLQLVSPDYPLLDLPCVNGQKTSECAV